MRLVLVSRYSVDVVFVRVRPRNQILGMLAEDFLPGADSAPDLTY